MARSAYALLNAEHEAAVEAVLEVTTPHVAGMIEILVDIAHNGKRDTVKLKAASKVIELHLQALNQQKSAANDPNAGRVVVIQSATLDQIEALQRGASHALPADAEPTE